MLIIENLAMRRYQSNENNQNDLIVSEERKLAINFRMIQLVELGAKAIKYKKNKKGGKLAMKDSAMELGFPQFLV